MSLRPKRQPIRVPRIPLPPRTSASSGSWASWACEFTEIIAEIGGNPDPDDISAWLATFQQQVDAARQQPVPEGDNVSEQTKAPFRIICDTCLKDVEILSCKLRYSNTYELLIRCHNTTKKLDLAASRGKTVVWSEIEKDFTPIATVQANEQASMRRMLQYAAAVRDLRSVLRGDPSANGNTVTPQSTAASRPDEEPRIAYWQHVIVLLQVLTEQAELDSRHPDALEPKRMAKNPDLVDEMYQAWESLAQTAAKVAARFEK